MNPMSEHQDLQPVSEYRTIPLTQGQTCKVDAADYEWLSAYKWHAHWNPRTKSFYAARQTAIPPSERTGKQSQRKMLMHREIMQAPAGIQVDHMFHDTLDNRRSQLRLATQAQNQGNVTKRRSNNTTGYRGVSWHKLKRKFTASIWDSHGTQIYLGAWDTAAQASAVYEAAAISIRGEFYSPQSE